MIYYAKVIKTHNQIQNSRWEPGTCRLAISTSLAKAWAQFIWKTIKNDGLSTQTDSDMFRRWIHYIYLYPDSNNNSNDYDYVDIGME